MFFSYDHLIKSNGKFHLVWMAAFCDKKHISRRLALSVSIPDICHELMEMCPTSLGTYKELRCKFSLYLHSQLLYGTTIMLERQLHFMDLDIKASLEKIRKISFHDANKILAEKKDVVEKDVDLYSEIDDEEPTFDQALFEHNADDINLQNSVLFTKLDTISEFPGFVPSPDWTTDRESKSKDTVSDISHLTNISFPHEASLLSTFSNIFDDFNVDVKVLPMNQFINDQTSDVPMDEPPPEENANIPHPEEPNFDPFVQLSIEPCPELPLIESFPGALKEDELFAPLSAELQAPLPITDVEDLPLEQLQDIVPPAEPQHPNEEICFELEPLTLSQKRKITLEERLCNRAKRKFTSKIDPSIMISDEEMKQNLEDFSDTMMKREKPCSQKYPSANELLSLIPPNYPKALHHLFRRAQRKYDETLEFEQDENFVLPALEFDVQPPLERDNLEEMESEPDFWRTPGHASIFDSFGVTFPGYTEILRDEGLDHDDYYNRYPTNETDDTLEAQRRRTRSSAMTERPSTALEDVLLDPNEETYPVSRHARCTLVIQGRITQEREELLQRIEFEVEKAFHNGNVLNFSTVFPKSESTSKTAALGFSCLLELLRTKNWIATQDEPFADIIISNDTELL